MTDIKKKVRDKKFKYWVIGTVVALIGVLIARLGIKYFEPGYVIYVKLAGYTFVIIGLFLLTFGMERKVVNKD